jgi:hypothetical protein
MSGTQVATSSSQLTYAIQGYNGINLTNWATSAASVIAAGSGVEVAGAFFRYSGDDTNDATSFSAIATNATAYLQLEPSGTVGSQIVTSSWTSTAPVWRESLNGWYFSAASNIRYVAGCVKTGATSYENKFIITPRVGTLSVTSIIVSTATVSSVLTASGGISENSRTIKRKIVDIGDWNMDSSLTATVATSVTGSTIRSANVMIRNDSSSSFLPIDFMVGTGQEVSGSFNIDSSGVFTLRRTASGFFDQTAFSATSFNRGYISIEYEA